MLCLVCACLIYIHFYNIVKYFLLKRNVCLLQKENQFSFSQLTVCKVKALDSLAVAYLLLCSHTAPQSHPVTSVPPLSFDLTPALLLGMASGLHPLSQSPSPSLAFWPRPLQGTAVASQTYLVGLATGLCAIH